MKIQNSIVNTPVKNNIGFSMKFTRWRGFVIRAIFVIITLRSIIITPIFSSSKLVEKLFYEKEDFLSEYFCNNLFISG